MKPLEKTLAGALVCLKAAFTFINSRSPLQRVFYRLKTELANLSCEAIKGEKRECIALQGCKCSKSRGSTVTPQTKPRHPYESCGCAFPTLQRDQFGSTYIFFIIVSVHNAQVGILTLIACATQWFYSSLLSPEHFLTPARCSARLKQ